MSHFLHHFEWVVVDNYHFDQIKNPIGFEKVCFELFVFRGWIINYDSEIIIPWLSFMLLID